MHDKELAQQRKTIVNTASRPSTSAQGGPMPAPSMVRRTMGQSGVELSPRDVIALQRMVGNHAVGRLLSARGQARQPAVQRISERKRVAVSTAGGELGAPTSKAVERTERGSSGPAQISRKLAKDGCATCKEDARHAHQKMLVSRKVDTGVIQRVYTPRQTGTAITWETADVAGIGASGSGALSGVVFIPVGGQTHVLKAVNNDMASVLFAEHVLGKMGHESSHSTPLDIKQNAVERQRIYAVMEQALALKKAAMARNPADENARFFCEKLQTKLDAMKSSRYIAVQTNMGAQGGEALDRTLMAPYEEEKGQGKTGDDFMALMANLPLWQNAGKVMAADMFLGNADRFQQFNPGNAFVLANGMLGLIDNEAIFQQFGAPVAKAKREVKSWVNQIVVYGGEALSATSASATPAAAVEAAMGSFSQAFQSLKERMHDLYPDMGAKENKPLRQQRFNQVDWAGVEAAMKQGFDAGLQQLAHLLSGNSLKELTTEAKGLAQQFPGGLNMDVHAVKMRGQYMKARAGGGPGASAEAAQKEALEYAEYVKLWKPKLNEFLTPDPNLQNIPERPAEMTRMEKFKRAVSFRSKQEKAAARLKKGLRKLDIEASSVDQETLDAIGGAGRRTEKTMFIFTASKAVDALFARNGFLLDTNTDLDSSGAIQDKKKQLIRANAAGIKQMTRDYRLIAGKWLSKLNRKADPDFVGNLENVEGLLAENLQELMTKVGA
jgi:hypothetical protein